jgi:hypothetical protein
VFHKKVSVHPAAANRWNQRDNQIEVMSTRELARTNIGLA